MGFRYDIQGLRALAVLLVFIFHLNSSWLSGGFIGVDIFFVISGYLVSGIILHKKEKGTFGFKDFYIGRIKRIVPVFLVFLILVGIVGSWVYLTMDIKGLRMGMFQSMIFNSNNYLAGLDNYFGASSQENPLLHTWTLSIEMQFYFLLPLFLIFVKKKYVLPTSLFIILLLFGYSFYNSTYLNNQSAMYFSLIARIPEFLVGTVFAIKAKEVKEFIGSKQSLFGIVSFIGIIGCAIFYSEELNFPGLWVVLPCVFAGVLLITTESKVNILLSNKIFVHIGELSYSIYLWHWAIMAFVRYYYVRIDFAWYEMIAIVVVSCVLSWLSYTYVENVLRVYGNKKFFIRFAGLVVCFGLVGFGMPKLNKIVGADILELYSAPTFGSDSHGILFKNVEELGVKEKNDSICLIGDSHAWAYKAMFDEFGKKYNVNIKTISNDSYPLIGNLAEEDFKNNIQYETFKVLNNASHKLIRESKYIFISSVWWEDIESLPKVLSDLEKSLRVDQKIIIVGDYPLLDTNPIRKNRSIVKFESGTLINSKVKEIPSYVLGLIKSSDKVEYFPLDYKNIMPELPYLNDTVVYYDATHFNAVGSRKIFYLVEDNFVSFFKKMGILRNN